jgi:hypothetical protein
VLRELRHLLEAAVVPFAARHAGPVPGRRSCAATEVAVTEPWRMDRSIEWARSVEPCGIEFLCDCATITEVQFDGAPVDGQEIAITCDRCHTVHWFTFHEVNP